MKKTIATTTAVLAIVGWQAWTEYRIHKAVKAQAEPKQRGTNWLTIDRPWVLKDNAAIIPVTAEEFAIITNKFKGFVQTNLVSFYD